MSNRNAANPREVKAAGRLDRRRDQRWEDYVHGVMATPIGRAFVWSVIARAGVFGSPFDMHGGRQSYNIGRGDFGRELLAEVTRLEPDAYLLMEAEARALAVLEAKQIAAHQTATATEEDRDNDH